MRSFSPRLRASAALIAATAGLASLGAFTTAAHADTPTSAVAAAQTSQLNSRAESLAEQAYNAANGSSTSSDSSSAAASTDSGASTGSVSDDSAASSDSSSTSYSGDAQSIAAQIVPADQLASFDEIISHESGWDVTATNPSSGAYGLPQALPGDKMASAGADWQTDAATQIRWALDYMNTTYGSPNQAWAFWQANSWY
ncbi:lytic transglycosylase domain-containing protein [Streptacidiphilus sp. N1-12]|uniref:Lytic transglycosylase domain-containing protein n=2 Tax=Streptacidiphilus alkalitolerans TaxID=3342712 RepID=A0ABV6VIN7_9ACTN